MDKRDSLADRMAQRLAARAPRAPRPEGGPVNWRLAAGLAALIALGPLATIVGAGMLRASTEREAEALSEQGRRRFEAEARDREARAMFRDTVRRPPVSVVLDRMARVVPRDARLTAISYADNGELRIEILALDPDPLRMALRRDPMFAKLRETEQRRAGAGTIVLLRGQP